MHGGSWPRSRTEPWLQLQEDSAVSYEKSKALQHNPTCASTNQDGKALGLPAIWKQEKV